MPKIKNTVNQNSREPALSCVHVSNIVPPLELMTNMTRETIDVIAKPGTCLQMKGDTINNYTKKIGIIWNCYKQTLFMLLWTFCSIIVLLILHGFHYTGIFYVGFYLSGREIGAYLSPVLTLSHSNDKRRAESSPW